MNEPTTRIAAALAAVDAAWVEPDVTRLSDNALMAVNARLADLGRAVQSAHAHIAGELASRSRPELGKQGLARRAGHRSPAKLIAAATGGHSGDAARLIQVGQATASRVSLDGVPLPARHPHIAEAIDAATLSVAAGASITSMLDKLPPRVDAETRLRAEKKLAEKAAVLSFDELQVELGRAEAALDPEGLPEYVADLRAERYLRITQDRQGMTVLAGRLDPETAAPVVAAVEAIVTHELRVSRGHNQPPAPRDADSAEHAHDPVGTTRQPTGDPAPLGTETRTLGHMKADALATISRHILGCDQSRVPGSASKIVVRMSLDQLLSDAGGVTTIDGVAEPIDAGTARRMAATSGLIPLVLGGASEVLDLGRECRTFSAAQRLVFAERDGGCAGCHLPPAFTEAHHLTRWSRGGRTDLDDGILLCTGCHHRVHDEGWEIRIDSPPGGRAHHGTVWFIPPALIDPDRTPRLGGRRRFDPLAWNLVA